MSEIINSGESGNNTRALLSRLDADVLAHAPDLVIVRVGTNDALNSGTLVPREEFCANLDLLVKRSQNAGLQVLLATIVPFHLPALLTRHTPGAFGDISPRERHAQTVAAIRERAREHGLPLAEVNTAFSVLGNIGDDAASLLRNPANSDRVDGVHPTAEGYALIAAVIYQTILAHQLTTSRIVCFGDSITLGKRDALRRNRHGSDLSRAAGSDAKPSRTFIPINK